ncbi:NAD(P)-binding protein [Rhizobium binae]|uniref:NAD(P)-binding protein n=1 Tax=Rhizobium binae TaxID=1138190 RepID=UPI001C838F67|nr:NAD(P)-binding protein [Rhizobium binae]MBX4936536.1 NAD(P)-binding protein [Rhizobium binae]MBX4942860.1 NAD(P)-binding protein [Rhizobium binae]MBX4961742.1 NAD(P)-binding protein [Rhizobium binae]MBX4978467.1 NAD(P)-binding protein [Rhizobium binae]
MDDASHHSLRMSAVQQFDIIVLGAGISGLVAASILSAQGNRVIVVDEYDHVGGNHIDWSSREGYTFDVGSLIFQDDSPLLRHFPELLERYVPIKPSWGRLNPQGKITVYPISIRDDIFGAGPVGIVRIFASVLYARISCRRMANARDFARYWIGAYLLDRSGLGTYMKRFYGVPAEEIDLELARKRMLWIAEYASLRNLLRRLLKRKRSIAPKNRQMARPREGFAVLYAAAVSRLQSCGVVFKLSASIGQVHKTDCGYAMSLDDSSVAASRIISTVPIEVAERICGSGKTSGLKTITLITLYFSFAGDRGFRQSIIYNFSHQGSWKRLTVYSDFYGRVAEREYFAVEVIAGVVNSAEQAEADFRQHVCANGLFNGDLKLEGNQILTNAYPIYSKGAAQNAAEAIARLRTFGIESIGRQGGFNYQPTARVSTIDVETAIGNP